MMSFCDMYRLPNERTVVDRRPAGLSDGADNLSANFAADRAFLVAVAEVGALGM